MSYVLAQSKALVVDSLYDVAAEFETFKFVVEASTLGISPARTYTPPTAIQSTVKFGNGQPLLYAYTRDDVAHVYRQELGCVELVVLND